MDPITETFTPSRSAGLPYTLEPKRPLPSPPNTCEILRQALNTCIKREINGEFCHALYRMHKSQCTDTTDGEN